MIEGTFHHIGIATRELEREQASFSKLGYAQVGEDFKDPIQGICGRFLEGPGPRIELVSPMSNGGVLAPWLNRGVKMYHIAYEVLDINKEIMMLSSVGAKIVGTPVPAVAFNGREIVFIMLPNLFLVELIQGEL